MEWYYGHRSYETLNRLVLGRQNSGNMAEDTIFILPSKSLPR